ncbi:hypothetical protein OBBRIDRAFT_839387 [Obba rivulosa]|uniref:Uncharacterized protein n=1 Tax=Obba rivulosa TaxID=1052685 RepID=A0A8E2ATA9_9APHY|nr:hypothetical protein OBBRIDRAFT_839387 [Obba rivulosa]
MQAQPLTQEVPEQDVPERDDPEQDVDVLEEDDPGFWVVLGGDKYIVSQERPFMSSGGRNSPVFPIIVKCDTEAQAGEVARAHEVLREARKLKSSTTKAEAILESRILASILPDHSKCRDQIKQVHGWVKPVWKKELNFRDALVYMIMKGRVPASLRAGAPGKAAKHTSVSVGSTAQQLGSLRLGPSSPAAYSATHEETHVRTLRPRKATNSQQTKSLQRSENKPAESNKRSLDTVVGESAITFSAAAQSLSALASHSLAPVYQYIRELGGLLSVEYTPHDILDAPSLGVYADAYVQSHGFTRHAITQIYDALRTCKTQEKFVERLVALGHPVKQSKWLWYITNKTPKERLAIIIIT